jgi:hypothetical protein
VLGGGREGAYRALFSKSEGNRSPRRPRGRWKNNIEIGFQHKMIGGGGGVGGGDKASFGTIWLRVGKNGELLCTL